MTTTAISREASIPRRVGLAVPDDAWKAITARDTRVDGQFVYGVRTTGIYCRPSCASRLPRREHVVVFAQPALAERAGFRACKRCDPSQPEAPNAGLALVQRACAYIDAHLDAALPLAVVARAAHGSPSHVQRTFKRVLGISPRGYVDAKRQERLRRALRSGQPVGRAVYDAGYGSSRPVYESDSASLGMTPATYRTGGTGHTIRYTVVDSPIGNLLVAATDRGLCSVRLGDRKDVLEAELRSEFPAAQVSGDPGPPRAWVDAIQKSLNGDTRRLDLPLDVQATAFQRRVWEALRRIPAGQTRSYAQVARAVGAPRAARAVARACATNPVALVVPCHRVVRAGGESAGYRWGIQRKRMLLDREQDAAQAGRGGRRPVRAVR